MSTPSRATLPGRRRTAAAPPAAAASPVDPLPDVPAATRHKTAAEIAALLRLAELDTALLRRPEPERASALADSASERRSLATRIPRESLDAYQRAVRGGRQPAVVRVVDGVCYGCFVRLHAKLAHQLHHRRGVASCPHCLRVAFDPAWLAEPPQHALGSR